MANDAPEMDLGDQDDRALLDQDPPADEGADGGDADGGEGDEGDGDDEGDGSDDGADGDDDDSSDESDDDKDGDEEDDDDADKDGKDKKDDKKDDDEVDTSRPTIKDIKTAYPDFFKKFPQMREMYFREREFSGLFPTVDDAKEASAKSEVFDNLNNDLTRGNPLTLLQSLAENNGRALVKVADNLLPSLLAVDKDLYLRTVIPVMEEVARSMHKKGVADKNKNMAAAAQFLSHFITGSYEIPKERDHQRGPTDRERDLEREVATAQQRDFNNAQSEVSDQLQTRLERDIMMELDKDRGLSDFMKKSIVAKVLEEVETVVGKDGRFVASQKALWRRASANGFRREDKASIRDAFLARVKPLVPGIRNRILNEARGRKSAGKDGQRKRQMPNSNAPVSGRGGTRTPNAREIDWAATRRAGKDPDKAFLDGDVKLRTAKR